MIPHMQTNLHCYGDNPDILRKYIPHESVDLVYFDPALQINQPCGTIGGTTEVRP